ncbi:MAG TPA: hypothetical protein DHV62_08855 [Elusimicrobia bacterium]|jgi:DNA-binding response OmpR family regulator|nr:hypothetical protein [Elusimicrobiota bacterium]
MKKILVIDDDLNIQEMLESVLSELGYEVDVASDGGQALQRVNQDKPDLIIMDIRLPDIDGISLCREIRQLKETSKIPIFMLTALSDLTTYHDAKLFGAVDYIVKPFDLDLLREKIEKVFSE